MPPTTWRDDTFRSCTLYCHGIRMEPFNRRRPGLYTCPSGCQRPYTLVAFTPIVAFLLGVSDVWVPYDTLLLSVVLFVVIPLTGGYLSRRYIIRHMGIEYFASVFLKKFDNTTIAGLLLTLVIIFSFQGDVIISNPIHIALIAIPLIIQTFLIFLIAYFWAKAWKLSHNIAAPAAMIGASNFFELAVAVAISLFGLDSAAALATVVGVLVEVPVMLALVGIANRTRHWFPVDKQDQYRL